MFSVKIYRNLKMFSAKIYRNLKMFGLNSTAKMKFFFDWDERGRKEMEESCGGRLPPLGHKDYGVRALISRYR